MKNKANQYRIGGSTYTTKHIGGIWRWTATAADGRVGEGTAANETTAKKAAERFIEASPVPQGSQT